MENLSYLFGAYSLIWVVFFSYALFLSQRQKRLFRELEILKSELKLRSKSVNEREP